MSKKIIKVYRAQVKMLDEAEHLVEAIVSTDTSDRYGDIVEPKAFEKKLTIYKAHPILLSMHNSGGGLFGGNATLLSQIGEANDIVITSTGLKALFKYYVGEGNPEADWAFKLAKKGIAAFSIGFMDVVSEEIKENGNWVGRRFKEIELLEISQVLIPANRDALQNSVEEGELASLVMKNFKDEEMPKESAPIVKVCTGCCNHHKGKATLEPMKPDATDVDKCHKCKRELDTSGLCMGCGVYPDDCKCEPQKDAGLDNTNIAEEPDTNLTHYTEHLLDKGKKTSKTKSSREDIMRVVAEGVKSVL